jgi:hypothetical protein
MLYPGLYVRLLFSDPVRLDSPSKDLRMSLCRRAGDMLVAMAEDE